MYNNFHQIHTMLNIIMFQPFWKIKNYLILKRNTIMFPSFQRTLQRHLFPIIKVIIVWNINLLINNLLLNLEKQKAIYK